MGSVTTKSQQSGVQSNAPVGFGTSFPNDNNQQAGAKCGLLKKTFLPKVFKQQLNSIGGPNSLSKDNRCAFPIRP